MKKAWNVIKLFFLLFGALSLTISTYQFFKSENEAKNYYKNCEFIKIGMPVSEAKKIMGDYEWYNKSTRSEIWYEYQQMDSIHKFYLSYPTQFGGSGWPIIYFDPKTMTVLEVICGQP